MRQQKDTICSFYLRNACVHGDSCRFSHSSSVASPPAEVRKICPHNLRGTCRFGDRCRDQHTNPLPPSKQDPVDPVTSQQVLSQGIVVPCKYFLRGGCTRGSSCLFSHSPLGTQGRLSSPTNSEDWRQKRLVVTGAVDKISMSAPDASNTTDRQPVVETVNSPTDVSSEPKPLIRKTTSRTVFMCTVRFGAGAVVDEIITPFESRRLVLTNLPKSVTDADVVALVSSVSESASVMVHRIPANPFPSATVDFTNPDEATGALRHLDKASLHSQTIAARLDLRARAVEGGTGTLASRKVKLNWFGPTASAIVQYSSDQEARERILRVDGMLLDGYRLKASIHNPGRTGFGRLRGGSVMIKNLSPHTTKEQLKASVWADSVSIRTYGDETDSPADLIRGRLERFGPLESFVTLPLSAGSSKVTAFAQFTSSDHASAAVKALTDTRWTFLNNQPVLISQDFSLKYTIRAQPFLVIKDQIDALASASTADGKIRYYIQGEDGKRADPVPVILHSPDPKAMGRVKAKLERLLNGEVLTVDGQKLWDEYFDLRDGRKFIREMNYGAQFFAQYDIRTRTIRLYGNPSQRANATTLILNRLHEEHARLHVIDLPKETVRILLTGKMKELEDDLGEGKLTLDVITRTLTVRGEIDDVARVRRAISEATLNASSALVAATDLSCPVCFCEVADPVRLGCDHGYCRQCLQHCFRSACSGIKNFEPLKCVAEDSATGAACGLSIPYSTIRQLLTSAEETLLLESSFLSYVQSHPKTYYYCPTADCRVIYREGMRGTELQCPSCLVRICPACHTELHEGISCGEYKDNLDGALAQWKSENGIKQCPTCKADIEKNGGCNHMRCFFCKTHICWQCMKTFGNDNDNRGIYNHMRSVHGGIGI